MRWDVRRFTTIDSTNRYLLDEASAGAGEGLVAAADHQTAGRGRRGRVWDSAPGASLLVSVLFWPPADSELIRYPQALGLAVTDACDISGHFRPRLKWPNDVVVEERKLAGILAETQIIEGKTALVVGCGINLNWGDSLPPALRAMAISADEAAGRAIDSDAFLTTMLEALRERLAHSAWIAESYRQRCATLGQIVKVQRVDSELVGKADTVDDDGALVVVRDDGRRERVTIGDVVHVRPA